MAPLLDLADSTSATAVQEALRSGAAVVLPNPSPLTYVVAATSPEAVNRAKRRPASQEVAVWVLSDDIWAEIAAVTDLTDPDPAYRLLREARITALLPVRRPASVLPWLVPAIRDDHALLFGTCWPPILPALGSFPYLYVSSANRTGRPPAAAAAEAAEMFGEEVVLDGDAARDPSVRHAATSMVRISPDGALELVRSGATDGVVLGGGHLDDRW
jgi:tRNA A37 threonylcarbamoyladenosine synthetase subunit TsaC/SUA5/YrdC